MAGGAGGGRSRRINHRAALLAIFLAGGSICFANVSNALLCRFFAIRHTPFRRGSSTRSCGPQATGRIAFERDVEAAGHVEGKLPARTGRRMPILGPALCWAWPPKVALRGPEVDVMSESFEAGILARGKWRGPQSAANWRKTSRCRLDTDPTSGPSPNSFMRLGKIYCSRRNCRVGDRVNRHGAEGTPSGQTGRILDRRLRARRSESVEANRLAAGAFLISSAHCWGGAGCHPPSRSERGHPKYIDQDPWPPSPCGPSSRQLATADCRALRR